MNRNGSGTAWLPDEAPMYGYMLHSKKWMYMIHGNLFLRYNNQDIARSGSRGAHKFDAPNWVMGMGQTAVGKKGLLPLQRHDLFRQAHHGRRWLSAPVPVGRNLERQAPRRSPASSRPVCRALCRLHICAEQRPGYIRLFRLSRRASPRAEQLSCTVHPACTIRMHHSATTGRMLRISLSVWPQLE